MSRQLKDVIKNKLIAEHGGLISKDRVDENQMRDALRRVMEGVIRSEQIQISTADQLKILNELVEELAGFGPIDVFLKDPQVTEVMINGPKKIYVERQGKKMLTDIVFESESQLRHLIYKIISPTRRRVDETFPYVDLSLPDGSRVNIVIEPVALDGSIVTIRKFLKEIGDANDLLRLGTLEERMSDFLVACIKAKVNIIFSGATGAGKTTTLNALSSYIANDERVITIEDTAELRLKQDHVVRMETRQANIEGRGEISIRDLFKNSLRMRPERIILGEIRGAEALDLLQAICSGHAGSLAILHASSPEDVIYRLETMILTSGLPITLEAIHRQINAAVNLIVQQEQLAGGDRKITHITQVNGIRDGRVSLEDIFTYEIEGVDTNGKVKGKWIATGVTPVFGRLFQKAGIELHSEIFNKD